MSYHRPATRIRTVARDIERSVDPSPITKCQSKSVHEHEVIHTDRVALAVEANRLVSSIVDKQTTPLAFQGVSVGEIDLTDQERETYDSALAYLKRQFEKGCIDTETVVRLVESDSLVERTASQ